MAKADVTRISTRREDTMSFGIYIAGFTILVGGFVYAAHLLRLPTQWIVVGGVIMIGAGIVSGVKATRQKDSTN
jgi:hypothetical protein